MAKNRFQKGIENIKAQDGKVISVSKQKAEPVPEFGVELKNVVDPISKAKKLKTNTITFYTSDEIKEALDAACFKHEISRSKLINEILKQALLK